MIESGNKPSAIARKLATAQINIEYAYLATAPSSRKGLLILRVNNSREALKVLTAA